ncbi:MAG: lamin tail domain-containing protein, partial [Candidatus Moranbacteria bacterium]|nr:lamin tail domain-containing protein [Candidatus Moranbacteria bacterium]
MKRIPFSRLMIILFAVILIKETPKVQAQTPPHIIINEIQTAGDKADDEFIELYNATDTAVDLNGWTLRKKSKHDISAIGSSIIDLSMADTLSVTIPAKGHFLWANSKGLFKAATLDQFSSGNSFTNDASDPYSIALFDADNALVDAVTWGVSHPNPFVPSIAFPSNPPKNVSLVRDLEHNSLQFQTNPTPENSATISEKTAPKVTSPPNEAPIVSKNIPSATTIIINEVLPQPSDTEEFIELFNFGTTDINLKGWSLHDASKTGRYEFKTDTVIEAQSYLTLFGDILSFALNNTNETVTLFDAQGHTVDSVGYAKSNKDVSYNFTPSGFRWSDIVTPDAPNQTIAAPISKTDIAKHIYLNMPAHFDAEDADEDTKYVWDFGDGHKSRLANATHTYTKQGSYTVTLTTSGTLEDTVQTFAIKVEKFPALKLVITSISPNPSGADTDSEWITIKNLGKKKIDLLDWSIATGTTKKTLANHPIEESFIIKSGKEIILTHDLAAFSLPNKGGFIELRRPDKKTADSLQYAKSGGVKEDEYYQKSGKKTWTWIQGDTNTPEDASEDALTDDKNTSVDSEANLSAIEMQNQSIETINAIINTIDALPAEELALLKAQIEAKLQLTALPKEPLPAENLISENTETSVAQTNGEP